MTPTGSYATAVTSREVRDLAELGGASRFLGERWEEHGGAAVAALLGQEPRAPAGEAYRCTAAWRLDEDRLLLSESAGRGLKSPDCLLAGFSGAGRLIIQPADFKFSLDIVTRQQIDPPSIRALIEGGGERFAAGVAGLLTRVGSAAAGVEPDRADLARALDTGQARLLPGFFLAPDEPANRLFLRGAARRQRAPVSEADVRLVPVDGATFYGPLPGGDVSAILRQHDGVPPDEADFARATYYFQLAMAVRGAYALRHRPLLPLFGPEPTIDVAREVRAFLATRVSLWAFEAARELAGPAIQRRERIRLAGRLASSPLRGRLAYEAAAEAGWLVGDEPGARVLTRPVLRELLDEVDRGHAEALARLAADRLARGPLADDAAVLAWLEATRPGLEREDRARLRALLAALE